MIQARPLCHPGSERKVSRVCTEFPVENSPCQNDIFPWLVRAPSLKQDALMASRVKKNEIVHRNSFFNFSSVLIVCRILLEYLDTAGPSSSGSPVILQPVRTFPPRVTLPRIPFRSASSFPKQILPWFSTTMVRRCPGWTWSGRLKIFSVLEIKINPVRRSDLAQTASLLRTPTGL